MTLIGLAVASTVHYHPTTMDAANPAETRAPSVFVFNPFTEGFMARGTAFAPVKHQVMLVEDLANLPEFLCDAQDIVLVPKRPSEDFLESLKEAGFAQPQFVIPEESGKIGVALRERKLGSLRPWAWGPDSLALFKPLFAQISGAPKDPSFYFNKVISELYSKAWSACFLRNVLTESREPWLCTLSEAGVAADNPDDVLEAIEVIRAHGHHRVVVKEAHGMAGHNALRLWEPAILPAQFQWMTNRLRDGRRLVIEPWLNRVLDFSVQLEMGQGGLALRGYTGLINDLRGQYQANWAEPNNQESPPAQVTEMLGASTAGISDALRRFFRRVFSTLEAELARAGYDGPISIDAFVYRTGTGHARLKPVVEINPRYTMGRLTLELMRHACSGSHGFFRLVSRAEARAEGFNNFAAYARSLRKRGPLHLEGKPAKIRAGALCLNDPEQAQACLAIFQVNPD